MSRSTVLTGQEAKSAGYDAQLVEFNKIQSQFSNMAQSNEHYTETKKKVEQAYEKLCNEFNIVREDIRKLIQEKHSEGYKKVTAQYESAIEKIGQELKQGLNQVVVDYRSHKDYPSIVKEYDKGIDELPVVRQSKEFSLIAKSFAEATEQYEQLGLRKNERRPTLGSK